jgi:hypothetical protein
MQAKKLSTLAAGLNRAALAEAAQKPQPSTARFTPAAEPGQRVLIGGHYPPEVRRTLKMVEANTGRELRQLLGEAINDLCAKYGQPQPYTEDGKQ